MRILLITAALVVSQPVTSKLCKVQLSNGAELSASLALTQSEQVKGLSGEHEASTSLIMTWNKPAQRAIWMKDTHMPLTAAFIGPDGMIQSIQDMEPDTETAHSSFHPVIAIVEVPRTVSEQLKWKRGEFVTYSTCFPVSTGSNTDGKMNEP
ncbi:TPA: DUF192 domain-containing protein [Klebsiella pneumoniae]|nr:DUF192 domain-containing protein [Klebsiella pneumoniae]